MVSAKENRERLARERDKSPYYWWEEQNPFQNSEPEHKGLTVRMANGRIIAVGNLWKGVGKGGKKNSDNRK
jgi:hypothetical protein